MSATAASPKTSDVLKVSDDSNLTTEVFDYVSPPSITGQIATALAKAQSDFTTVPKTKTAKVYSKRTGSTYTYKYADLADILKMALPILAKNELAFTQPLKRVGNQSFVTTRLVHSSGEVFESDGIGLPEGLSPQELGSALTYFRRYDASALLGISADEDEDATIAQENSQERPRRGRREESQEVVEELQPGTIVDTDNVMDVPTKEERAAYGKKLRSFELDSNKLRAYVLKVTGAESIKVLTKAQFETVINLLENAENKEALINDTQETE